jgi:hypothetical protein
MSNPASPSPILRLALTADALFSGASGLLLTAGSGLLSVPLGLPQPLLLGVGLILIPFSMFVGLAARQRIVRPRWVWAIIAMNAFWAIESIALLVLGWLQPTALGVAFVVGQAAIVGLIAEAQYVGLKRSDRDPQMTLAM